jgi:hypothetical protein
MSLVTGFIKELRDMIFTEDLTDYAKNEIYVLINEFEDKWLNRTGPNYDAMIKERDEHIQVLQKQIDRLEQTANELRYEKEEIIKQYEERLKIQHKKFDHVAEVNADLHRRNELAEDLVMKQAQFMVEQKKRYEEIY